MGIKSLHRKKIVLSLLLVVFLTCLKQKTVLATYSAGSSATISYSYTKSDKYKKDFIKKIAMKNVLEKYRSPLVGEIDDFIKTSEKYQLDYYLLPSIAGLESSFGRFIYPNSYNPFGWGRGYVLFSNWGVGIDKVGKGLRTHYLDKGAVTIDRIGTVYSESPTWARRVKIFVKLFNKEEEKISLLFEKNNIEL